MTIGKPMEYVPEHNGGAPFSRSEIETWLRVIVAELLRVSLADVSADVRLTRLGIDSTTALIVSDMLCEWLGLELEPTLLYRFPTIAALSAHLAELSESEASAPRQMLLE